MKKKVMYILGLRKNGQDDYALTTWMGDAPIYYAIFDRNPGYWDDSEKVEPLEVSPSENKLLKRKDWLYIGFGWLKDTVGGKIIKLK